MVAMVGVIVADARQPFTHVSYAAFSGAVPFPCEHSEIQSIVRFCWAYSPAGTTIQFALQVVSVGAPVTVNYCVL